MQSFISTINFIQILTFSFKLILFNLIHDSWISFLLRQYKMKFYRFCMSMIMSMIVLVIFYKKKSNTTTVLINSKTNDCQKNRFCMFHFVSPYLLL